MILSRLNTLCRGRGASDTGRVLGGRQLFTEAVSLPRVEDRTSNAGQVRGSPWLLRLSVPYGAATCNRCTTARLISVVKVSRPT
jgi:hypothetical protein